MTGMADYAKLGPPKKPSEYNLYEILIPPQESQASTGRFGDSRWGTLPYLKTLIRAEAYHRSNTRKKQLQKDTRLSQPRMRKVIAQNSGGSASSSGSGSAKPQWGHVNPRDAPTMRALPPVNKRAARYAHRGATERGSGSGGGADASSARYSETPFHRRKQQAKVFSHVSDYVARERAIITSGRTFTWGGRMKYEAPTFNPDRNRMVSTGQWG